MKSRKKLKQMYDFVIFKSSFACLFIRFVIISRKCRIDIDKFHYNNNFNIFGIVVKSNKNAVLHSNFRCSTESILVIISHIHLQLRFLFKTCNNREGNLPVYCVKNSCWTDKKMCLLIITMIKCHSIIGFAGII